MSLRYMECKQNGLMTIPNVSYSHFRYKIVEIKDRKFILYYKKNNYVELVGPIDKE